MRHPHTTRTIGRTVVVVAWLLVLAVAGEPDWAAALLGAVLVLVWASPYLLVTNRRAAASPVAAPAAVEPGSAGPSV
jgi:hypothetical protein